MTDETLDPHSNCEAVAGAFMAEMNNFTSELALDYSVNSLQRLDAFIAKFFSTSETSVSDTVIYQTGCYLGEVIRRNIGGTWTTTSHTAELSSIRETTSIYPVEEARKCFSPIESQKLAWYYHTLDKQTYSAEYADTKPEMKHDEKKTGGVLASLARMIQLSK
jgi:hypothetical protein